MLGHCLADHIGKLPGEGQERLAGQVPIEFIVDLMGVENSRYFFLQVFVIPLRRIAKVKTSIQLGRSNVRCTDATLDFDHLKTGRRKMLIAVVPYNVVKFRENRRKASNRIVGKLRVCDMSLYAFDAQHAAQRTSPADSYGIAKFVLTGRFTQNTPVDPFISILQRLNDFQDSIAGRSFFITGNQKCKTAVVIRVFANESLERHNHGGEPAFHICRATAV